jgi:murein DD-endopeptidase MepM/ murein hydrolase activator NlpD
VAGAGEEDIGSVFGDSRDGGRRRHHGIDIFKPRGTPVLAAADGPVTSVDTTEIGGHVVWQREADGRHAIYYAHLDRLLVREGQRLRAGDTVGLLGNTGNARTTPPHLHFGAYRRGPQDPWDLILPIPLEVPDVAVDLDALGEEGKVNGEGVRVRRSPSTRSTILAELSGDASFRILAGAGDWYRVFLPSGVSGYIDARYSVVATQGGTRPSNQQ